MVHEKNRHFKGLAENDPFIRALQKGVVAIYSGLVMGHDLPDDRAMLYAWLDLTVRSGLKHEKGLQSCYAGIRADHSMSTGLWYGRETMQKWRLPGARGGLVVDTGVVLKMDGALAMNIPMHIDLSDVG